MHSNLVNALQDIEGRMSVSRAEFVREHRDESLLAGLHNRGLLLHDKRQDRYAVNDAGRRCLDDLKPHAQD